MRDAIETLTEREREALRMLLAGHDAKSIARDLDLSVHAINDRLRNARRKLGVSSSREAARMLGEAEGAAPQSHAHNPFGVGESGPATDIHEHPKTRWNRGNALAWLGGGMLMMSLILAATLLVPALGDGPDGRIAADNGGDTQAASEAPPAPMSETQAFEWLGLIDDRQWAQSWEIAGEIFRSQVAKPQWVETAKMVREPLGAVESRELRTVSQVPELPGVPPGSYEVLQFETDFANRPGTVEILTLAREDSDWKVIGYFIR